MKVGNAYVLPPLKITVDGGLGADKTAVLVVYGRQSSGDAFSFKCVSVYIARRCRTTHNKIRPKQLMEMSSQS